MIVQQSTSRQLKCALFGIAIITTAITSVKAEEITFRISFHPSATLPQGTPLTGLIKMKTPDRKYYEILTIEIPNPGQKRTSEINCTGLGKFFTAALKNNMDYRLEEAAAERKCQAGEINFEFLEKTHAGLLRRAVHGYDTLRSLPDSTILLKLQGELTMAIENDQIAVAFKTSTELRDTLAASGHNREAEAYRVLSLDLANEWFKSIGIMQVGAIGLVYDKSQKKFVLDDQAVNLIKQFQSEQNLVADGKLNWPTITALGKM